MCGLISMISRRKGGFFSKDLDMFEQMLVVDSIRGKDSTGALTVLKNKTVRTIKIGAVPQLLFRCTEWGDWRKQAEQQGQFLVGHNRAATRGAINSTNAHPFSEDHIILVHNGTLRDHAKLTDETVEVDSHAICHALVKGTPQDVLPTIDGAFALIWYNVETEKLYAIRNKERPLALITTEDNYILSSEAWIGSCISDRNRNDVKDISNIEPGDLLEFSLDGTMTKTHIELEKALPAYKYGAWHGRNYDWEGVEDLRELRPHEHRQRTVVTHLADVPNDPMFKVGERLQVKMWYINEINKQHKATGKVTHPSFDMVDFTGTMPEGFTPRSSDLWLRGQVSGVIRSVHRSNCGLSLIMDTFIRHAELTTHNGTIVSTPVWNHVMEFCTCHECGKTIQENDRKFTNVKLTGITANRIAPHNAIEITCADCIESKIKNEAFLEQFQTQRELEHENYLAAVQNRKSVSDVVAGKTPVILLAHSPGLH